MVQSDTAVSAFPCPAPPPSRSRSLQPYLQWQRPPFPKRLPALVAARKAAPLFCVQTPTAKFSGHKPHRLCGKDRRFGNSSYARRTYTAVSAFPCPAPPPSRSRSLQPYLQWQRPPFPKRLPALVAARKAAPLFCVQTPTAKFSGHKPHRLCGKDRRFGNSSYARRTYTAVSAFLIRHSFFIVFYSCVWQNEAQEECMMKKMILAASVALLLAACSDSEEPSVNSNTADDGNVSNENNAVDHGVEDVEGEEKEEVGFTLNDKGEAEAAEVPEAEAEKILAAYQEYIDAFNAEDVDRYMEVIAKEPDGFDREEDRAALTEAFTNFDTTYKPSNETIVEYEENRAEVYAQIEVTMAEPNSDKSAKQSGRQVVVFKNEDGAWKVTSLHFIGNQ
ncbi:nuclear transport factor 2 family protein [Planococcus sp. NCCP-2050]|uniref:nuclear transport factor 2 family protein n=1 Tax=Planococcus sp. NCCP-2050 TaxID=2944679 RepID=UPI00203B5766|nr:nuclear transport factor 2 family protein [Planococcus sp. NCCP-2050]